MSAPGKPGRVDTRLIAEPKHVEWLLSVLLRVPELRVMVTGHRPTRDRPEKFLYYVRVDPAVCDNGGGQP